MAQGEIHQNDIGTQFEVTVKDGSTAVDLAAASTKQLIFTKPSGAKVTKTASDGTATGQLTYTTASGDLNETGEYRIQAFVIVGGNQWHSDIGQFTVHSNL